MAEPKLIKVTEATQEKCKGKMNKEVGQFVLDGVISPEQGGAFLIQRAIAKAGRSAERQAA